MRRLLIPALLFVVACGAEDRTSATQEAPDAGDDTGNGGRVTMTGTVWAPGNAPGQVAEGQEIPVSGAIVYLSTVKPDPMVQKVECIQCIEAPSNAVITDAKGKFTLTAFPDTYWLVIQKAQFRVDQQLIVTNRTNELPPEMTTLPSVSDPANGKWIPRIALASGGYDHMETILGKMGIGQVNGAGVFVDSSAEGIFDVYNNGGNWGNQGNVGNLVKDLEKMLQYDIIFFPCTGDDFATLLNKPLVLKNIRDYVAAGGRLYVADWAGEWADNVFPAELKLGRDEDTPAAAYNRATDTWDPSLFGTADGGQYDAPGSKMVNPGLKEWLDGQNSLGGPIDAENVEIVDNWNYIPKLNDVVLGKDADGNDVVNSPRAYVMGPRTPGGTPGPLLATYEPAGCGRVLFSTFHTVDFDGDHSGLIPQERVLMYLLLEIGSCKEDPEVE